MKGVVKYGQQDGQVELRDAAQPEIGPADVLIEIGAAGVCGSDIEQWHHDVSYPVRTPVIMGHEFAGTIVKVGEAVEGWAAGDRVACETAAHICGKCPLCRSGEYNLCPERLGFGYGLDGAFTRYTRVPARCLHRVPDGVAFEHAALTEPGCVAYNALIVKSQIQPGEPAVILGPGPIGLFALQVAQAAGAHPIILTGTSVDARRLKIGEELGADRVINSDQEDPVAYVNDMTGGYGVPLVVDAAGPSATLAQSLELVARNGQITKIGWGPRPVGFSLDKLLSKAARLQGVFSHTWRTWEAVLHMISSGQIRMAPLITHEMSIAEWERGYRLVESREAVKVILRPE